MKLKVNITDRAGVVFEGDVDSLTSYNTKGQFDILPSHANFITIIKNKIIINTNDKKDEFAVDNGVLKVDSNVVKVYLGIK